MPGNDRGHAGRAAGKAPGGSVTAPLGGPSPQASLPGDAKIVALLNRALRNELTAINQYFLHSRMLADWGLNRFAEHEYKESVDEMKHADMLIKRILFLGGLPNLQDLGKLMIGENAQDIIRCDLSLEMRSLPDLKEAVVHCEQVQDFVSRALFVKILQSEEDHIDWLQTQSRLIDQIGLENFLQLQSKPNG